MIHKPALVLLLPVLALLGTGPALAQEAASDPAQQDAEEAPDAAASGDPAAGPDANAASESKDDQLDEPAAGSTEPADAEADTEEDAEAEPTKPPGRFSLRYLSLNGVRYNPLGLISSNTIGARYRLYDSDNPLLKNNFVGLALTPTLSGGFGRFGALAEIQPLSVMRLWARFDAFYYWGIFNLFQSFSDPSSDYSDTKMRELGALEPGDKRRHYSAWGTQLTLGMDLQIKLGPVVARNFFRLVRSDFNLRDGDRVYFDQLYDVLAPNQGFYAHNDTDFLGYLDLSWLNLLDGMRFVGGIRNSVTVPMYNDVHFAPDNADRASANFVRQTWGGNVPIWRVGPLVSFTLFNYPGWAFNQPTVFFGAQWHILHRWRTGADVSIFIPYTFLGLRFQGDFLTKG